MIMSQHLTSEKMAFNISLKRLPYFFLAGIALITLIYSFGINFTGFNYDQTDIAGKLAAPNFPHFFGTDPLGRDLLTRVLHGGKMSLSIGLLTAFFAFFIGTSYGSIAGYIGGKTDEIMMRLIDLIYSLPDLLVLSIIALFVSRSTSGIVIGLALINWMDVARLTRTEIKKLKEEDFTEALRSIGLNHRDIVLKHLLPNAMGSIIVALSFTVPRAILAESTLSFIGLGLSPPDTSWGTLAGDAWQYLRTDPHLIIFPSLMIFLTVFSLNQIGDHLRDMFSPHKAGEHILSR